jgi:hypothetical protein
VPVVKDPLDGTQRSHYEPVKIEDKKGTIDEIKGIIDEKTGSIDDSKIMEITKPVTNSRTLMENAKTIIESPRNIINKARTIIGSQRIDSQKNELQKNVSTKVEPPEHHEEIKEQIERKKVKREISLYRKMFGTRNK